MLPVPDRPSPGRTVSAALVPVRSVLRRLGEQTRLTARLSTPVGVALLAPLGAGVLAGYVAAATDGLVGLLAGWAVVIVAAGVAPSAAARTATALSRQG